MRKIYYKDGLFSIEGAVSVETNKQYTAAWRIDFSRKELFPYLNERHMGGAGSGVRIEFSTNSINVEIDIVDMHKSDTGFHDVMMLDLVCNGKFTETLKIDNGSGLYKFKSLESGVKKIEIWLDQAFPTRFRCILIDGGSKIYLTKQNKKRWINYGSSISHSVRAESPSAIWPGLVALEKNLHLTNLGFGGNCILDPMMVKIMRDMPADIFTLKLTSNMHGGTLNERSFPPNVIGLVETIREKHPLAPIVMVSSIYGPTRENVKGAGNLSLYDMRIILEDLVNKFKKYGDENIYYVNGLDIMGAEAEEYLPDLVHPDAKGQYIMAEGFIRNVFDKIIY